MTGTKVCCMSDSLEFAFSYIHICTTYQPISDTTEHPGFVPAMPETQTQPPMHLRMINRESHWLGPEEANEFNRVINRVNRKAATTTARQDEACYRELLTKSKGSDNAELKPKI